MKKVSSQRAVYFIRAGITVALIIVALVLFNLLTASKPVVKTTDPSAQQQRVNVFVTQPVNVQRQWTGYGTAEATHTANVPARVTATVDDIPGAILEGVPVTRGQLLVQLDETDYANQLDIAKQNLAAVEARLAELDTLQASLKDQVDVLERDLALAEDDLKRVRELFDKKASNQKDLDAAERSALSTKRSLLTVKESLTSIGPRRQQFQAERAGLKTAVDTAETNLQRCAIKSPIDGTLQTVDVEVGESVTPGQRVARVVSLDQVEVPLSMAASARSYISKGDSVTLSSTADSSLTWRARVDRVTPEDDPQTRTFLAYVRVTENQDGRADLAPGVFVSGVVHVTDPEPRLVVPRRSIRTERVMLVKDGMIKSSRVEEDYALEGELPELGLPDNQWAVIESGIDAGDQVVLNPTRSLSDGQKVQAVSPQGVALNEPQARSEDTSRGDQQ